MLSSGQAQGRDFAIGHPALTDPETGLANHLHFELVYSYLFAAGNRGLSLSVMLISVSEDALSQQTLRQIGQTIRDITRQSDLVAHVGRGRYVVLLQGSNLQGARIAADRVESEIGELAGAPLSFGLAAYSDEMKDPSQLLEAADKALLAAEAAGGGVELA